MSNLENQSNVAKQIAKEYFGNIIPNLDEVLSELKFEGTIKSSNFDYKTKTIFINLKYKNDINHFVHELFHAISTNYYSNGVQIGFNSIEFKNFYDGMLFETNYGYALNEGATHSFTRDATNNMYGEINPISCYNFCANIFKNLENNFGKDKMKVLYTDFGTKDFISSIASEFHTSEENVLKLVLSMDAYLDTYRIYSVFLNNFESEDTSSLLSNCYKYLARVINDKLNFEKGENSNQNGFDFAKYISTEHLSDDEKILFKNAIERIEAKDIITPNSNVSVEKFENLASNLYNKQYSNQLTSFKDVPDDCKCAEFYNYLLLNNYICDEDRIRKDILKSDLNAALTRKIFSEKYSAFNFDDKLPENIRTLLSLRYTIRAGCTTSDYYMQKCLSDSKFVSYLKNTDNDYYEALVNMDSMSME